MKQRIYTHLGRRGAFLLFLAILDLIYAYALAFPTHQAVNSPTYFFLATIIPLEAWAVIWATVGMFCLIYAFRTQDAFGFAAAIGIKLLWAWMFLLGWMFGGVERGYLSTAIWGAFAGLVWIISGWPDPSKVCRE